MNNFKIVYLIQTVIIIALVAYIFIHHSVNTNDDGLLSNSLYKGAIDSESHLIFNFEPLEDGISNYISDKNGVTGVYITNLRDGASLGINEEEEFEPASLNKIPMAILIMKEIERGKISLDSKITILEEDADSASGEIYKQVGKELTVKQLLHAMLAESDNTAFATFSRIIDWRDWETLSDYLNYYDISTYSTGRNQDKFYSVTPKSNAHLFSSLYLSTVLEKKHSEYILEELTNTTFNIKELAGIPDNITIAQKFGSYYSGKEEYFHSCGIMYLGEGRFFFCIMTKGQSSEEAIATISKIIRALYDYVIEVRKQTKDQLATL